MDSSRRWEFMSKKEVAEEMWHGFMPFQAPTCSMAPMITIPHSSHQDQFLRIPLRLTAAGLVDEFRMFFPPFSLPFSDFPVSVLVSPL